MKRLVAAGALLALSACGGSGGSGGSDQNSAAAKGDAPAAAAQPAGKSDMKIRAGQWETVVQISGIAGMPKELADALSYITTRHCITQEEAAKANANVFTGKEDGDCTGEGFKATGGRIKGTMTCTGGDTPGEAKIEMDGTYTDDSYDLTQKMTMAGEGGGQTMTSKVRGRRIGDCTGNEEA